MALPTSRDSENRKKRETSGESDARKSLRGGLGAAPRRREGKSEPSLPSRKKRSGGLPVSSARSSLPSLNSGRRRQASAPLPESEAEDTAPDTSVADEEINTEPEAVEPSENTTARDDLSEIFREDDNLDDDDFDLDEILASMNLQDNDDESDEESSSEDTGAITEVSDDDIDADDDFDLDAILSSLEDDAESRASEEDGESDDSEPAEYEEDSVEDWADLDTSSDESIDDFEIDFDEDEFSLGSIDQDDDKPEDKDGDEDKKPKKEKKPKKNKQKKEPKEKPDTLNKVKDAISPAVQKYLSLGAGVIGFLAKIPIIGIPFKALQNNNQLSTITSAIILPVILFSIWFIINIVYVSGSDENDELPDQAAVSASFVGYDSDANTATISLENTGGVMTEVKVEAEVYSNQFSMNPLSWFIPTTVTTCETEWELADIGDISEVQAQCESTDAGGFWTRGSIDEILG